MYEHLFFLVYHGKGGFTDAGIKQMSMDEVFHLTRKLYAQLKAEQKVREDEAKKATASAMSSRARANRR